jgi:hypothetical protein
MLKMETTFIGSSSSQLNGERGNLQRHSILHLHLGGFAPARGLLSLFGSFGERPLFLSLSFSLTHLGVQGSSCSLAIVCELCVCMLLVSLRHVVLLYPLAVCSNLIHNSVKK